MCNSFPRHSEQTLKQLNFLFTKWKELNGKKESSEEFQWTQEQLKGKIEELTGEVEDLHMALDLAEKNTKKKPDSKELAKRKQFVKDLENSMTQAKTALEKKSLQVSGARRDLIGGSDGKDKFAKFDEDLIRDNQDYIDQVLIEQEKIKQQQGKGLDQVITGVEILKEKAHVITDELDGQKKDLEVFDGEANRTKGLLQRANAQMNQLLKGSDKGKLICIGILVFIIVVMIIVFFALT